MLRFLALEQAKTLPNRNWSCASCRWALEWEDGMCLVVVEHNRNAIRNHYASRSYMGCSLLHVLAGHIQIDL